MLILLLVLLGKRNIFLDEISERVVNYSNQKLNIGLKVWVICKSWEEFLQLHQKLMEEDPYYHISEKKHLKSFLCLIFQTPIHWYLDSLKLKYSKESWLNETVTLDYSPDRLKEFSVS